MGYRIEITVRDESRSRIDNFKCNSKEFPKIVGILFNKYGIRAMKPKDKDLNWLEKAKW